MPRSARPRHSPPPFQQRLLQRPLLTASALLLLVSFLFLAVPRLDVAVSALFYDPTSGFRDGSVAYIVREIGRIAEWTAALALAAPLLVKLLAPESRLLVPPRASLFALAALAIGPGLIVNGILKHFWGRARPREIIEFGGDASFSPAWWISDQCGRNCSFVSGEAAAAFWLVTLVFVVPRAWRPLVAWVAMTLAMAVSFVRVAGGGHFLSDVIIAWLLTLIVIIAAQRLILQGLPPEFDASVEAGIRRAGLALRRWWAARDGPPATG
jgi:lipid A 4'-phosphatase